MEVSKGKKILYSLWLVPICFALFVALISLIGAHPYISSKTGELRSGGMTPELVGIAAGFALFGLLIMMLVSRQKKHRIAFYVAVAVFGLVIVIENVIGVARPSNDFGRSAIAEIVGFVLWELYIIAAFIFALIERKKVVEAGVYVRSPEYKQEKARQELREYENEKRRLRREKAPSAAAASRIAAAVGTDAPAAPAAPAAPVMPAAPKAAPVAEKAAAEPPKSVDLNRCTTQELLDLPGMALADAARIVKERETKGAYASVEDCVARVGLKPHLASRYLPLLTASAPQATNHPPRRGRALDL